VVDFTARIEVPQPRRNSARLSATRLQAMKGILAAVEEPLVSIDYKGDAHSSSVDLRSLPCSAGKGLHQGGHLV